MARQHWKNDCVHSYLDIHVLSHIRLVISCKDFFKKARMHIHIDVERISKKIKKMEPVWADWGNGSPIFSCSLML